MSALPSFPDIFLIILIVIPGYISVRIFRKIGGLRRIISDTELLYTSLIYSIIIYTILGWYFQLNDYDSLKAELLKPYNIPKVLATTIIVGVILGAIVFTWRIINNIVPEDCWTSIIYEYNKKYDDIWVIVYSSDGKEYKGSIGYWGIGQDSKEITIVEPYRILRDEKFKKIEDVYLGEEMLFTEKDILRVLFMKQEQNEDEYTRARKREETGE